MQDFLEVGLLNLKHIDLRKNNLGFKSASFIMKKAMDGQAVAKCVDLKFNKVSELMINSLEATLQEFSLTQTTFGTQKTF
jgi:hypothetical protein